MQVSQAGIELLKREEGYERSLYFDQASKPTIGIGHLISLHELGLPDRTTLEDWISAARVRYPVALSDAEVIEILHRDLAKAEAIIASGVTVKLTQNQHDALVSFVFNTGTLGVDLKAKLNAGEYDAVPAEMARFNHIHVNGQPVVSTNLTHRRAREAALWNTKSPPTPLGA